MTLLQLINVAFTWVGLTAVVVTLGVYSTQGWWRTSIGRFIVMMKAALFLLYALGAIRSIVNPLSMRGDLLSVAVSVIVGLIMSYGAFAFVTTIHNSEHERKHK